MGPDLRLCLGIVDQEIRPATLARLTNDVEFREDSRRERDYVVEIIRSALRRVST